MDMVVVTQCHTNHHKLVLCVHFYTFLCSRYIPCTPYTFPYSVYIPILHVHSRTLCTSLHTFLTLGVKIQQLVIYSMNIGKDGVTKSTPCGQ